MLSISLFVSVGLGVCKIFSKTYVTASFVDSGEFDCIEINDSQFVGIHVSDRSMGAAIQTQAQILSVTIMTSLFSSCYFLPKTALTFGGVADVTAE
jgi:hypothetical protein